MASILPAGWRTSTPRATTASRSEPAPEPEPWHAPRRRELKAQLTTAHNELIDVTLELRKFQGERCVLSYGGLGLAVPNSMNAAQVREVIECHQALLRRVNAAREKMDGVLFELSKLPPENPGTRFVGGKEVKP